MKCKMKKSILQIFLALLFLGCSKSPTSELVTIQIPNKTDIPLSLANVSMSINKIQLETKDNVLLGFIKDVKLYNERIFVVDPNRILIFDLNGIFLQILGRQGEGPEEYTRVTCMEIDEKTGNIYVSAYNKIIVYNKDFEFVEERKLGYPIQYLKILNGGIFIVSEEVGVALGEKFGNQSNLYELNSSFQILDTIPVRTVLLDHLQVGGSAFRYWLSNIEDGLFLFMPVLTPENLIRDTLYQIKDEKMHPAIRFNFERPQTLDASGFQTLVLLNIVNSTSYYILEYDQDWKHFLFLYNKKTNTGYNLSEGLIDEEGDPVFLRPLDLKKDHFYYIKKFEFEDKTVEEKNPIIGIVKLK